EPVSRRPAARRYASRASRHAKIRQALTGVDRLSRFEALERRELMAVVISEVDPAGSGTGSGSYNADWFEGANTGPGAVHLTGWKMDDNSNSFASSVPLHGLTTLPAGKSAIFLEDTGGNDTTIINAFSSAWYGAATPPASLLFGFYGGSGVGLSQTSDAVNLFDSTGSLQANVSFGTTSL